MTTRFSAVALAMVVLIGCSSKEEKAKAAADAAEALLKAGDLPGASAAYEAALKDFPTAVPVATGAAYMALLAGDAARADQILAGAEGEAGAELPNVKLRRSLAALHAGDLEKAKEHGLASGLPAGKLIAAEVNLADGERDAAKATLTEIESTPGAVGEVVGEYLALINSDNPMVAGLSEAQALWVLGERKVAVRSAEELVLALPEDVATRDTQLMVWASRAATAGEPSIARSLLDATIFPPDGQAWRKVATSAIASCAFNSLEGVAPADGLADARATAAILIAKQSPEVAKALAGPYVSNAAARALLEAGDSAGASAAAPGGVLASYLKAGG